MPNASTLQFLLTLAKGIASQFGPNCEVVVHDLATNDPERSIVAIENGHVTGRKAGDGPSHVVLEALRGNPEQLHDHLSYLTRTKDGKILKSTTIYIRDDDGAPIGIFGINYDITLMLAMENAIKQFTATEKDEKEPEPIARNVSDLLDELIETLLDIAQNHLHTIMPGYTHLQKAQPVTLAHYMMAYVQMFLRDRKRFQYAYDAANVMPLGSGALAATTYPLNRQRVAELLDFPAITQNSLDGVSDRDFLLDYLSAASLCMMHLSRFCEELILWNSSEFHFVEMDDAFSTGSSIMPQKKNPDVAELLRGKTGRVYGDLFSLLTVMKGIPLAYNKDMQEDKEPFFDARDTLLKSLPVFTAMLQNMTFREDVMEKGAAGGFTNATDCADYLTKKGVPFRDAHRVVGELVNYCIKADTALMDLSLEELKSFHPAFEQDVFDAMSLKTCVEGRSIPGGPAPSAVQASIDEARKQLAQK